MALFEALFFLVFTIGTIWLFGKMIIDAQRNMANRTEHIKRVADALERIAKQLEDKKYKK